MMVEQAWLDEGDCVFSEKLVNRWSEYINYVTKNYPKIHNEVINHLNKEGL